MLSVKFHVNPCIIFQSTVICNKIGPILQHFAVFCSKPKGGKIGEIFWCFMKERPTWKQKKTFDYRYVKVGIGISSPELDYLYDGEESLDVYSRTRLHSPAAVAHLASGRSVWWPHPLGLLTDGPWSGRCG